jgi:citrate/tricarballylate utilization protein
LMIAKGSIYIGPTLIIHLSFVLALFITLPYGKFVHGFYRLIALIKYAEENSTN